MKAREKSVSVAEYLARAPSDRDWARKATEPYAELTPTERLAELTGLNAWMDVLLAGKDPETADGELPFWRHWGDPSLGRPV